MNYYINKSHKIYKKYGLVDLIVKIILFIFNKPDEIQKAQINVWNILSNMYGSIVQYGPFKGMKIGKKKVAVTAAEQEIQNNFNEQYKAIMSQHKQEKDAALALLGL